MRGITGVKHSFLRGITRVEHAFLRGISRVEHAFLCGITRVEHAILRGITRVEVFFFFAWNHTCYCGQVFEAYDFFYMDNKESFFH